MEATIPVTIDAQATAHVAELGLQGPFRRMLQHALTSIPDLRALHVELQPAYDMDIPCVLFWATKAGPGSVDDPTGQEYGLWKVNSFPPEVSQHFVLLVVYEAADGR